MTLENKKKQVNDLTVGNPLKVIFSFYIPLLCTCTLQQLYNIADSMIVGKGIGDNALAAVGNMGSLTFLTIGSCMGLSNGFSIPVAQSFGAKEYDKMRKYVGNAVVLAAIIVLLVTFLCTTNLHRILIFMRVEPVIIGDSLKYGYVVFGFMSVTLAYNLASGILRALGDSKTPMIAIFVASATNIVMDYILIFIIKTGVIGAASATVFSQFVSFMICYLRLRKIEILKLQPEDFQLSFKIVLELLKNGVPMAIMNSITALGCMVVQFFVNGMGVAYTAAYASCSRYINLFMQPSFAVGNAMAAYASQNYGAKKYDRIAKGCIVCLGIAFVSYVIFAVVMTVYPRWLAGMMLNGDEQISLAMQFLPRCGVMMWTVDFLFVLRSGCQGMGKSLVPMISGAVEMGGRIAMIFLFVESLGFVATAYAEIGAWSGALLLNAIGFVLFLSHDIRKAKRLENAN